MIYDVLPQKGGAECEADALCERILSAADTFVCSDSNVTYYVSDKGDDKNPGTSPEKAIRSFEGIALLPLKKGDMVLLERGSFFRIGQKLIVKTDGVYFGAYGEGEKPILSGSLKDYASAELWEITEKPNIWKTPMPTMSAGIITFNYEKKYGTWYFTADGLKTDGDFYHDTENGIFYLYYSKGNPGESFDNIEISSTDVGFRASYITGLYVENITFKHFTFGAFHLGEINDVSVQNCVVGWSGGKFFNIDKNGNPVRYGNAFQVWYFGKNIKVRNCWIYQQFDAALTFQGSGENVADFRNITFEDNLMEYCSMNFEFWAGDSNKGEPPHISDISFCKNIIRFAGYGWSGQIRYKKENQAALLGWYYKYSDLSDFIINDNIIDCTDCRMIYIPLPSQQSGLTAAHNSYYQKKNTGRHGYTEIIVSKPETKVENQSGLESAIALFDASPKTVKWLNI